PTRSVSSVVGRAHAGCSSTVALFSSLTIHLATQAPPSWRGSWPPRSPSWDPGGPLLAAILAAVVPVVAGINLEYYFSYVDPTGYGCGTKLPHNVTSLLGVLEGAQRDFATGLPWQMVEIHEPTRLAIVVEGAREHLSRVVERNPSIERLVRNRWIWIACLDHESGALWELSSTGFVAHTPTQALSAVAGDSAAWYQGKRGFLAPGATVPGPPTPPRASAS